jgi:hypothetical protein
VCYVFATNYRRVLQLGFGEKVGLDRSAGHFRG